MNCRYHARNRRAILESRVNTTRLIGEAIAGCAEPPLLWMNASTATIYRHALDRSMDEMADEIGGSEPGIPETWRFSIEVARHCVAQRDGYVSWIHDIDLVRASACPPAPGCSKQTYSLCERKPSFTFPLEGSRREPDPALARGSPVTNLTK